MGLACSGWGSGAQQTFVRSGGNRGGGKDHQTHCWVLRQQARGLIPCVGVGAGSLIRVPARWGGWRVWGVLVAALLWWWGVVFDLWIVVASISTMRCMGVMAPAPRLGGGWCCVWCGVLLVLMQFF